MIKFKLDTLYFRGTDGVSLMDTDNKSVDLLSLSGYMYYGERCWDLSRLAEFDSSIRVYLVCTCESPLMFRLAEMLPDNGQYNLSDVIGVYQSNYLVQGVKYKMHEMHITGTLTFTVATPSSGITPDVREVILPNNAICKFGDKCWVIDTNLHDYNNLLYTYCEDGTFELNFMPSIKRVSSSKKDSFFKNVMLSLHRNNEDYTGLLAVVPYDECYTITQYMFEIEKAISNIQMQVEMQDSEIVYKNPAYYAFLSAICGKENVPVLVSVMVDSNLQVSVDDYNESLHIICYNKYTFNQYVDKVKYGFTAQELMEMYGQGSV